jgi:hypothetical protein
VEQFFEKAPAQLPAGLFQTQATLPRERPGISAPGMKLKIQPGAQIAAELLVLICLLTAQPMIQVGRCDRSTSLTCPASGCQQQGDRIRASTESDQQTAARELKAPGDARNELVDPGNYPVIERMTDHRASGR